MERDLGAEIVRTFGARLRGLYEPDDEGLPIEIAGTLERLKRAEQDARLNSEKAGSKPPASDEGEPKPAASFDPFDRLMEPATR